MRFEELRREQYEKGLAEGEERGAAKTTERLNKLNDLLMEAGRIDDLKKSWKNPAFQQQLLEEFGLTKK